MKIRSHRLRRGGDFGSLAGESVATAGDAASSINAPASGFQETLRACHLRKLSRRRAPRHCDRTYAGMPIWKSWRQCGGRRLLTDFQRERLVVVKARQTSTLNNALEWMRLGGRFALPVVFRPRPEAAKIFARQEAVAARFEAIVARTTFDLDQGRRAFLSATNRTKSEVSGSPDPSSARSAIGEGACLAIGNDSR